MNDTANSVMITLARESRGISQTALADHIGVTQAAISKIESGHLKAEGKLLLDIAAFLKYPVNFFCRQFDVYPPGMHFYRKHKTLPAKAAKQIEATINVFRLHISELLRSAEVSFVPIPECDIEEYGNAREVARAVRQYLHLPRGPVKNVTEVLESMGIVVIPFNPKTRLFSGVSLIVNAESYAILINSEMPGDRFRWTLVHELAHIIMHKLPTDTMESEADEFAGEFLMPSDEIIPELGDWSIARLSALKRRWKVSMNAIVTNAQKLNILSDWQNRNVRIEMANYGITRTQEPNELNIPIEQPALLSELLDFHFSELRYSLSELSELVGLQESEFTHTYKSVLPAMSVPPRHKLSLVSSR